MTGKQKKLLFRILLCATLFLTVLLLPKKEWGNHITLAGFLVPYLVIGFPILKKAAINIGNGQVFDENFLMALATVGALVIGEYPEAVFVLLFYEIGELFESLAVGKSRRSITALMDIRPDTATVMTEEGEKTLTPEEVEVGQILLVRPGEKVPLDGCVIEGASTLNTVALTGESAPREVTVGDTVLSGCINGGSPLRVRVTRLYHESTASKILALVEESTASKAKSEALITRFAKYYTPLVVIAALCVAVVPSLIDGNWVQWIYRALSFLVISCPCALVISVPLSFFAGIGAASKNGILVKGSQYLERLASCETVVLDKTGTITEGVFAVKEICPMSGSKEELLYLAATAERYSTHPIAESVKAACGDQELGRPEEVKELAGRGVIAEIDGQTIHVGNARLMAELGVECSEVDRVGTVLHLAKGTSYLGYLVIADRIKEGSGEALLCLKKRGVKQTVMLTGDVAAVAEAVAQTVAVDRTLAGLLPDGKVAEVERLLSCQKKGRHLLFAGDGINDAPVLARADVGVAMGALGSDAAIEAADVVIMDDDLRRLDTAIGIARKTVAIVKQNIVFSLAVKAAVLILTVVGLCSMWVAVFADVGVMVLAVLNALRAMKIKGKI